MTTEATNVLEFPFRSMLEPPRPLRDPEAELRPPHWVFTRYEGQFVTWAIQGEPVNHGGAVGWAALAMPLEHPEGKPWPEGLSREVQWLRAADVEIWMQFPDESAAPTAGEATRGEDAQVHGEAGT